MALKFLNFILSVFCLPICLCTIYMSDAQGSKKRIHGTGVTHSCDLLCKCWGLNSGPPERASSVAHCWVISPVPVLS